MATHEYDFDLAVIGAGSAGVRLARMAASRGVRVVVFEKAAMGGTCVNVGCVPKKLLVYGAEIAEQNRIARHYGWATNTDMAHDWAQLIRNKDREITRLNGIYEGLLERAGVHLIRGSARLSGTHQLAVGDTEFSAQRIVIATGGWPFVPDIPGAELGITSNEVFSLDRRPERVLIVGGGYIAVEFAGIFNGFGSHTIQTYRGPLFLRGFDTDIRHALAKAMMGRGVDLRFDADIKRLERIGSGAIRAHLTEGAPIDVDCVLFATGRHPATAGLGLEEVGVDLTASGQVRVDRNFQTSVPSIYALGDVSTRLQLTPVALAEAMSLLEHLYGEQTRGMSYEMVPTAVFSQPPIGTVGFTEEQARTHFGDITVYQSSFRPMQLTMTDMTERAVMKLIVCTKTDRVVGLHMLGPHAGEITQGFAVAMKNGATKADFDRTIGIHPTAAEEFVTMRTPKGG
jgi:glutathione reductase (NADPH)